jgi:hypothetical protein
LSQAKFNFRLNVELTPNLFSSLAISDDKAQKIGMNEDLGVNPIK